MSPAPYVSRVNQIDAGVLDDEIFKILKNQAKAIAQYTTPGKIDKWQPEIDATLRFLIWFYSLRDGKSTFGQRLLNLHYPHLNGKKAILYLILTVVPRYVQARFIDNQIPSHGESGKLKYYFERLASIVNVLEFVNIIIFLHRGIQPFIIERLLGIYSQPITTHEPRTIGYSFMARELLWHGLIELFTVILPLINFHYIKQAIKHFTFKRKEQPIRKTFPVMTISTKCAYCDETPILPVHAGCEHIFCYYCLKANFTATRKFYCPKCNAELYDTDMKYYVVKQVSLVDKDDT